MNLKGQGADRAEARGLTSGKRLTSVDVLRGIGILFVIAGHLGFVAPLKTYLYSFHMPLFFAISGFLFSAPKSLPGYLWKKTRTLLLPYAVFGLLGAPLMLLRSGGTADVLLSYLKNLALTPFDGLGDMGTLWFLPALFICEISFALLLRLFKNKSAALVAGAILAAAASVIPGLFGGFRLFFCLDTGLVGLGFFVCGILFRAFRDRRGAPSESRPWRVGLWALAFVASAALALVNGKVNLRTADFGFVPLFWLCAILGFLVWFYAADALSRFAGAFFRTVVRFLCFVGQNSLLYMVFHSLWQALLQTLCTQLFGALPFPYSLLLLAVQFVLIVALLVPVVWLFEKTPLRLLLGKTTPRKKSNPE